MAPALPEPQKCIRDHNADFPVVVDAQGVEPGRCLPVGAVSLDVAAPRTLQVLAVDAGQVGDVQTYQRRFLGAP